MVKHTANEHQAGNPVLTQPLRTKLEAWLLSASNRFAPLGNRARPVLRTVTGLGWSVLGVAVLCWLLAGMLGWVELLIIATACLLLFVLCCLLTIGRTTLRVQVLLDPLRITAGDSAAGQVSVTNLSRARLLPIALELPVGTGVARFDLPSLAAGAEHDDLFLIPPAPRGVIPVGPATTVRGDPLGLLRRSVPWTPMIELFVRPVTVPLEPLGAGLLRDLEGQTTNDMSTSDLAFHALREYAPGDDRRYIHWRSSAKMAAATPDGKFFVRQFLDTRRSHLTLIIDATAASYSHPDEFEVAVSAGASVAIRALSDEVDTTVLAGRHLAHEATNPATLDIFSRAEFGAGPSLAELASTGSRVATDTSIALIISGSQGPFIDLQRAASHFPPEVRRIILRCDSSQPAGIAAVGPLTVLSLPNLNTLPAVLRGTFPR